MERRRLEESQRGAVELWQAGSRAAADLDDQVAQLQVGEDAVAVHAAHLFDPRARNRLLKRHDGERLVSSRGELARNLRAQGAPDGARKLRAGREMNLVVVSHHHHTASFERSAKLVERLLDRGAVGVPRLLQLAKLEGPVRAEEDGF